MAELPSKHEVLSVWYTEEQQGEIHNFKILHADPYTFSAEWWHQGKLYRAKLAREAGSLKILWHHEAGH